MKNQIKNRFTGAVMFESDVLSIRQLAIANIANLSSADLSSANLSHADLSSADLSSANLSRANLSRANLSRADLSSANLSSANLSRANLSRADLSSANLSSADLSSANLRGANLSHANLRGANLSSANLSRANLSRANLSRADLSSANLSSANLSRATALKHACDYLSAFEQDELGLIVYKRFGCTEYPQPDTWAIGVGSFITENVNPDCGTLCGCGVNFGSLEWCQKNYKDAVLWKCRIRFIDLADIVVPFGTDGKARCHRLELLEVVK